MIIGSMDHPHTLNRYSAVDTNNTRSFNAGNSLECCCEILIPETYLFLVFLRSLYFLKTILEGFFRLAMRFLVARLLIDVLSTSMAAHV